MPPILLLAPSLLAMAWLVSKVQWFWSHNPDLQFGWVVLLLCAYLFYEAWEQRPPIVWKPRWWATAMMVAGIGLLFTVQVYQAAFGTNAASTLGLALGVLSIAAGNVGLVFGWRGIRSFAMPYAFILIALPLPSMIQGPVVSGLQHKVALVNTEILNLFGVPAQQVGSLIKLPNGTVGIDEACSGIRSLQSTVMAALFIGYLSLRSIGLRLVLLSLGIGLAVLGNLVRSLYLSWNAYSKGMDAVAQVHDAAGWSILAFTAAGIIVFSYWFSKLEKAVAQAGAANGKPSPRAPPS